MDFFIQKKERQQRTGKKADKFNSEFYLLIKRRLYLYAGGCTKAAYWLFSGVLVLFSMLMCIECMDLSVANLCWLKAWNVSADFYKSVLFPILLLSRYKSQQQYISTFIRQRCTLVCTPCWGNKQIDMMKWKSYQEQQRKKILRSNKSWLG